MMKEKWIGTSSKLEAVLARNGGEYFVGKAMTYPDVLVAHLLTWYVEEVSHCHVLTCAVTSYPSFDSVSESE